MRGILKYCLCLCAYLFVLNVLHAEEPQDSSKRHEMKAWVIDNNMGSLSPTEIDTAYVSFYLQATDHPYGIGNSWNGNMGSPILSKSYFERTQKNNCIFLSPYAPYYKSAHDVKFYDTKVPFSSVEYLKGNPSYGKEERLRTTFAVSPDENTSVGFDADYIYGRGMYIAQSTNDIASDIWGRYEGKHYGLHAIVSMNRFKNYENGGIVNDSMVKYPDLMPTKIAAENMEVNLSSDKRATSQLKNQYIYYTHRYSFGTERATSDSTTEFIDAISLVHTLKYEHNLKTYREKDTTSWYNTIPYLSDNFTKDKTEIQDISNTIGVELTEAFNRRGHFGLQAFVQFDHVRYRNIGMPHRHDENSVYVGGEWAKRNGEYFNYQAAGKVGIAGANTGDFDVSGLIDGKIKLGEQSLSLNGMLEVNHYVADFLLRHYRSNYFSWDNDWKATTEIQSNLSARIPRWDLGLTFSWKSLKNTVYFNQQVLPTQSGKNVQIFACDLKKNFTFWLLHLDNQITYQKTSQKEIIPLPDLMLYHNFYIMPKFFKVLVVQIGVDVHYHTRYAAPSYMPAIGQFYNTGRRVGNYPFCNVYANIHLKRATFFVSYTHFNYKFSNHDYFLMPSYPANPGVLKMGLKWNFYD